MAVFVVVVAVVVAVAAVVVVVVVAEIVDAVATTYRMHPMEIKHNLNNLKPKEYLN